MQALYCATRTWIWISLTKCSLLTRSSPLQLWRCAPLAKGVGFAMIILSLVVSIYYNVIMAYSVIYVGASIVGIFGELPWTVCGETKTQLQHVRRGA